MVEIVVNRAVEQLEKPLANGRVRTATKPPLELPNHARMIGAR
jgi:hypothetical protein